jgi:hypothetical protein
MKIVLIALLVLSLLLVGCTQFGINNTGSGNGDTTTPNPNEIPTPPSDAENQAGSPPNLPF